MQIASDQNRVGQGSGECRSIGRVTGAALNQDSARKSSRSFLPAAFGVSKILTIPLVLLASFLATCYSQPAAFPRVMSSFMAFTGTGIRCVLRRVCIGPTWCEKTKRPHFPVFGCRRSRVPHSVQKREVLDLAMGGNSLEKAVAGPAHISACLSRLHKLVHRR
jgi:hypothetical protein